ncbi:MAG TPA: sulfotransferase [Thermomicrobiales bacterium]|nr:sulfotransferase [Thermomicrobiales bacterium]
MTEPDVAVGIGVSTLQVIGPGFGRTGTLSMQTALERLGFALCDHMVRNERNPERFPLWDEALRRKLAGEPIDWRLLLTGFRAIVDWLGAYFWRELVAAHPGAKVVLTVRDPDRWYDSIRSTIFALTEAQWPVGGAGALDIIFRRTFGNRLDDREHCQTVLARHIQSVRETIDPERLLVFEVKQGWEPLCAFLDMPVPEGEPFPHVNDTAAFWADE